MQTNKTSPRDINTQLEENLDPSRDELQEIARHIACSYIEHHNPTVSCLPTLPKQLLHIDIKSTFKNFDDSFTYLANIGWTVPKFLTPGEILDFTQQSLQDNKIDEYFVNLYTCDKNRQLHLINDTFNKHIYLAQWHPLIEECLIAFSSNLYKITIPSLLTVIEGLIAKKTGILRTQKTSIIQPLDLHLQDTIQFSFFSLIEKSILTFIRQLFAKSNFSYPRPPQINRHWILHGRDETSWTITDSIKLFNAIQTIIGPEINHAVKA